MSWYNNQNQGFIDATQELNIGLTQATSNYLEEINEVFIPKILDTQNGTTDTLIVNNTANSRIFIKNSNTTPKIRIEGGKLYLYYDYDILNAAGILSGWVDVVNYVTNLKAGIIAAGLSIGAIELQIASANTTLTQHTQQIGTIVTGLTTLEGEVALLSTRAEEVIKNLELETIIPINQFRLNRLLPTAGQRLADATIRVGQDFASKAFTLRNLFDIRFLFNNAPLLLFFGVVFLLGGQAQVALDILYAIRDVLLATQARANAKTATEAYDLAKDKPNFNTKNKLLETGIIITQATNNNMGDGEYDILIKTDTELKFNVLNGVASITEVIRSDENNNIGDTYNINKALLGGSSGTITLTITAVYSYNDVLTQELTKNAEELNNIDNRIRRRANVLNTSTISNNFVIDYTPFTETTGEVVQVPTIRLNLNSGQLETINGVLNVIKYVNTDTTDAITKLLLPTGATLTSDYKLNLGYKEYFTGYAYDLIMMAIKKDTYSTFTPSNYNNDFLGYFPNMARLANSSEIRQTFTNGLLVNSSQHFTKGLIYFKNTSLTKTFNMNRKFEFITFLKFVSFNNNTTDYHIIQTGKDGLMEVDDKKLSVYIRDRKLKIQHPALVSYNVFTNGINTVKRLMNTQNYQIREPFGALNDNIIWEAENLNFANYKYRYRMLNVPYLLNNESQYINTPTALLKITDDLPNTFQANEDTKFISLYLNHPSNPNQPIADCIWPSVDYLMGINDNGTVMTNEQFTIPWYIKRVVLRFDVLLHRITDENPPEGGNIPWPVLYQEANQATLCTRIDYALSFRIVYSYDGINLINHNFTIYDVFNQGGFVNTGKTVRTGWYDNHLLPKKYLTYTFEIPNTYPNYGQKVRIVKLEIIKKTGLTYYPANASASIPYTNQPVIFLYEFNAQEYGLYETGTTQVIYDKYVTTDSLTTLSNNINLNQQYLTTLQLDLPNNSIKYVLDTTSYTLANRGTVKIYAGEQADIPMPHPDIPFVTASFVSWAKLTNDNSNLVIGNNPSEGEIDFTHFNWRFFQNSETFLTATQLSKMMPLISSNYYYDYVNCDKLLNANEIFTNSINTNRLMIGSNVITSNFTTAQRAICLRSDQTQDSGNLLIDIKKLYVANPVSSGSLTYNHTTKTFGIGTSVGGVGTRSEEDDITRGIIQASAGFALQWNNINKTLNVIPENIWQDLSPYALITTTNTKIEQTSNFVIATSNFLQDQINIIPPPYDDTALYAYINTKDLNVSNFVIATSNFLNSDYITRDDIINTTINTKDGNVSNFIIATSNFLQDKINIIPPPYNDTTLTQLINTKDGNVSNYVKATSNFLNTDYITRDNAILSQVSSDLIALSNDYVDRDTDLTTDYIARDVVLNNTINALAYNDGKVNTYLTGTLGFYGNVMGNTGIGTGTPQRHLHLHKEQASAFVATKYTNITTTGGLLRGFDVGMDGSQQAMLQNYENTNMYFATNGSARLLIQANGNIGIGTNSVPEALLHLHKPAVSQDVRIAFTDSTTGSTNADGVVIGKLSDQRGFFYNYENQPLFFGTNSTERMRIMASGDVGIGTDNVPFARLHLHRAGVSQDVRIQFTDSTTGVTSNSGTIVGKLADGRGFLYNYHSADLFFGTSGAEHMRILANGNVGIGTTTTTAKLRVEGTLVVTGQITCGTFVGTFLSVANTGTDYLCIQINTTQGTSYQSTVRIAFGSFTGFHRCYTDDILYNEAESDLFKNKYAGRLVISTGKIKTDYSDENNEWQTLYDKEGITIEDSLPIVALSRQKKDKKIFGVLGLAGRASNDKNRLIINSVGEGAICVANSNGNIENGDYLQSSDLLGYAERQDDDILHNYTVAKATIDCNFELDSPYYQCYEENGVRYALIACTYHCG